MGAMSYDDSEPVNPPWDGYAEAGASFRDCYYTGMLFALPDPVPPSITLSGIDDGP